MQNKIVILKRLLMPFSILYWSITAVRNFLFDKGFFKSKAYHVPVISVGNITVGGTGKTPHIELLIRMLLDKNVSIAVLSRGYKRSSKGFVLYADSTSVSDIGDEPKQIAEKFPDATVAVAVCEKRTDGISALLKSGNFKCILLDDAFQHRWVLPSLSILLVDYNRPIWRDYVFPVGMMREGFYARKRADIVIVTKCPETLTLAEAESCRLHLKLSNVAQLYFSSVCYSHSFIDVRTSLPLEIDCSRALVLTGIAQHSAFVEHLTGIFSIEGEYHFADHYHFSDDELIAIFNVAEETQSCIITTEKDAARLKGRAVLAERPMVALYYLPIVPRILFDQGVAFADTIINHISTFPA